MQQRETVEEYLKRGGRITTLTPSPTFAAFIPDRAPHPVGRTSNGEAEMVPVISWRDLHERHIPQDDPKYWKKLNNKLDEMLKKT